MRKSFAPSLQSNRGRPNEKPFQEISSSSSTTGKTANSIRSASNILDLLNESTNTLESPRLSTWQKNSSFECVTSPPGRYLPNAAKHDNSMKNTNDCGEVENFLPIPSPDSKTSAKRKYNVVWGKLSKKKHKKWEGDGVAEIGLHSVVLKDCDGKVLGSTRGAKTEQLEEGSRLIVGGKEIELIDLITSCGYEETTEKESLPPQPPSASRPLKRPKLMASRMVKSTLINTQGALVMPIPPSEHQQTSIAESTDDDAVIDELLSL